MLAEAAPHQSNILGNRYIVQELLGAGGMGVVYRTLDRLTGESIALKRLTVPESQAESNSPTTIIYTDDIKLILAQEFRMLASLRHPHIISVLDYGFDTQSQPYFTMELLEDSKPLVIASRNRSLNSQIALLNQTLQALAYLHRRGVFHRDLKPDNIQVIDENIKVLDFGLAVSREYASQEDSLSGTLPYMAPELFDGQIVSAKSDLYAVGVMAYELFAGHLPFDLLELDILTFTEVIQTQIPDFSILPVPATVRSFIARLLAKKPEDRFESANDALIALCNAAEIPIPPETIAIRESYLQAAQFIGREIELEQLDNALYSLQRRHGSAWLLEGETGVGKSRLLHEISIRALVQGALVLQSGANEAGGQAYQAFQDIVRRLVLLITPDDLEASVLKPIIPDIGVLLGHTVPDAPILNLDSARLRLFSTITALLRRVQPPMMIIVEDLQWTSNETLDLLAWISQWVSDLPIVLLGSYRNDDKPKLSERLPNMQTINLSRLSREEVTALSESMLGSRGAKPEVIELLQRETEGNVFFMVEVVRALAEEAGRLEKIGQTELPKQVSAWGIQTIIQRRLDRVDQKDRSLLTLAALAGRELDLAVLKMLEPSQNLERWLTNCSEVAVLEVLNDRWYFTHDKLRESTLAHLPQDERPAIHRRIAVATEDTYQDHSAQASILAFHWARAGDKEKECTYSLLAGREMAKSYANAEAVHYLQRALDLANDNKILIMYELAKIWETSSQWDEAEDIARQAIKISVATVEEQRILGLCHSFLGNLLISLRGDYTEGFANLDQAKQIFEKVGEWKGLIEANIIKGRAFVSQGDILAGLAIFEKQQALAVEHGDGLGACTALRNIGHVYSQQGDLARALDFYQQSLEFALENDDLKSITTNYSSLGVLYTNLGDINRALEYYLLQLENFRKMGDIDNLNETIISIGNLYMLVGDYTTALECCEQGVINSVNTGHYLGCSIGMIYIAECYAKQKRIDEAAKVAHLAIEIVRRLQKAYHLAGYLVVNAEIHYDWRDYDTSQRLNAEALEIATQLNSRFYLSKAQALAIRLQHAMGKINTPDAVQELDVLLGQSTDLDYQADLYYAMWQIDSEQQNARQSAVRLYRELFDDFPQIKYQQRYKEMAGNDLPEEFSLPPLPDSIELQPSDLQPSLHRIECWLGSG